jgi:hypothetical protein
MMLVTLNEHVKPAGVDTGGLVRVTVPVKPFPGVMVSVDVPATPTATDTAIELAVMTKSGFVTVSVMIAE